jgi:hypothetical protein
LFDLPFAGQPMPTDSICIDSEGPAQVGFNRAGTVLAVKGA